MLYYLSFFLLLLTIHYSFTIDNNSTITPPVVQNKSLNNTLLNVESKNLTNENTTVKLLLREKVAFIKNETSMEGAPDITIVEEVATFPGKPNNESFRQYLKKMLKSKSDIDENCTMQADCEAQNTLCLEGTCQCQSGYVAAIDKLHCLPIANELGAECVQDKQCFSGLKNPGEDAVCISFKCVCATGTIARRGTCLRKTYLGDKCKTDKDCLTANSLCLQEVCACPNDMIPAAQNERCIPVLKNFEDNTNCTEDEQCQHFMGDNSICSGNKCQCKPRHHFDSTMCVQDLKLGSQCTKASDCDSSQEFETRDRRDCIDNKCSCSEGYKEIVGEDTCISSANNLFKGYLITVYALLFLVVLRSSS